MEYFTVDKAKCKGDGTCVAVCPVKIIKMDEHSRIPEMIEKGQELCIRCGHCVAVCPAGALSLSSMPVFDCLPQKAGWRLAPEQVEQFLKSRRSIRLYRADPVERATLEKLIDIARFAPSGINRQPVYWAIIYEQEKIRKLLELIVAWMRSEVEQSSELAESFRMKNILAAWDKKDDWICRGAPHLVIAYSLKDDPTAPSACTIALTYLEFAAVSFGLGTCWAGYAAMAINLCSEVKKFLGLSAKTSCFGAMMVGHPKVNYFRIPLRNKPHIIWR